MAMSGTGKLGKKPAGRGFGSWVALVLVFTGFLMIFGLSFAATMNRHNPALQYEQSVRDSHVDGSDPQHRKVGKREDHGLNSHTVQEQQDEEVQQDSTTKGSAIDVLLDQASASGSGTVQSGGSEGEEDATSAPTPAPKPRGKKVKHTAKQQPTPIPTTPTPTDAEGNVIDPEVEELKAALKRAQERIHVEKQKIALKEQLARVARELEEAREWEKEVEHERRRERERQREKWAEDEADHKRWRRSNERARVEEMQQEDYHQTNIRPKQQVDNTHRLQQGISLQPNNDQGSCPGLAVPPIKHYAEFRQTVQVPKYAYATFVTTADFVIPTCVLMHSIALSGAQYSRVIAVTSAISENDIKLLSVYGQVVRILPIASPLYIENARYRDTFTKLRIWQLTEWDKLLYIDTDVLIVRNLDDVFDLSEWAVPMDAMNGRYSTGMMLVRPRLETFQDMMVSLKTTQVSMELPDLLFLQEFFDNHKTKINLIPRWYQVYQEEFGAQHKTYLTDQQAPINIFDPRIHGIHYPGAGKPFNNIAQLSQRWGHLLCDWMGRDELNYEPQFLWYWAYELMRRDLNLNKQKSFFTHEMGKLVVEIGEAPIREATPAPTPAPPYSAWDSWHDKKGSQGSSSPVPVEGKVTAAPVFKGLECNVDTPDGVIDIQRLEPITIPLRHTYVGFDGDVISSSDTKHEWAFTWCTPFRMTPEGQTDCSQNGFASEYSEGYCRSSFGQGLEVSVLGDGEGMLLKAVSKTPSRTKYLEARLSCSLDPEYHDVWANSSTVVVTDLHNTTHSDRLYSVTLLSPCFCPGVCLNNDTAVSELVFDSHKTLDSGRCGTDFPLASGSPAECNPLAFEDKKGPCCSSKGYCGATSEHCTCTNCVDYRKVYKEATFRQREEERLRTAIYAIGEYVEPTPMPTIARNMSFEEEHGVIEMDTGSDEVSMMADKKAESSSASAKHSGSASGSGSGSSTSTSHSKSSKKGSTSHKESVKEVSSGSDEGNEKGAVEKGADMSASGTGTGSGSGSSTGDAGSSDVESSPAYVASSNATCTPHEAMLVETYETCVMAAHFLKVSEHAVLFTSPCNIRNPRGCYLHQPTSRVYWNPCGNPFSTSPNRVVICRKGLDPLATCIQERKWLSGWELASVNSTERRETIKIELDRYYFRADLPVLNLAAKTDDELAQLCMPDSYLNKTDIALGEVLEDEQRTPPSFVRKAEEEASLLPMPDVKRKRAYVKRRAARKIWEKEDEREQRELMENAGDELGKDYEEMLAYRKSQAGGQVGEEARNLLDGEGSETVTIEELEEEYKRVIEQGDYDLAKKFQKAIRKRREALLEALVQQKRAAAEEEDFDQALRLKDEITLLNATIHAADHKPQPKNFTIGGTVRLAVPVLFKNGTKLPAGSIGTIEMVPGSKKVLNSPATVRINGILFDLRPKQAVVIHSTPAAEDDEKEHDSEKGKEDEAKDKKKKKKHKKKKKTLETPEPDVLGADETPVPIAAPLNANTTKNRKKAKAPAKTSTPKDANTTTATTTECPTGTLEGCIDQCPTATLKMCVRGCVNTCKDDHHAPQDANATNRTALNATCSENPNLVARKITVANITLDVFLPNETTVDNTTLRHAVMGAMLMKRSFKRVAKLRVVDVGAGVGIFTKVMAKKGGRVMTYEPRKAYHQALICGGVRDAKKMVLANKKGKCLVKMDKTGGQTDLAGYTLGCTHGNRTVSAVRGDTEVTKRIHVLRVATIGTEDQVLEGFRGVFEGPGVDYVISTVSPQSLKGIQAFFADLPGKTALSWTSRSLASLTSLPSAPIATLIYQRITSKPAS
eukprot:TRINITY_DN1710_c0_g3_i1.p1 TRINITY_DN1710_c0_g3~~TRINITY_DN1710_c0_g3_i1.p1  ORF type:complete len:1811 (+),score=485.84 TRINITY_DN1710_c0_g3_i1:85-5517(+)